MQCLKPNCQNIVAGGLEDGQHAIWYCAEHESEIRALKDSDDVVEYLDNK